MIDVAKKYIVLSSVSERYFESTWKTDNLSAGSSNNNQVKLPLDSGGTYNFTVFWGDGQSDNITTWNQAETTHTYPSIGTYNVKIKGQCEGFRFNATGDRLKILTIDNWGKDFRLGNAGSYFYNCSNLQITAKDYLIIGTTTNLSRMFRGCSNLNAIIKFDDTSNVTNMWAMFYGCSEFNSSLSYLKTDSCVHLSDTFGGCTKLNQSMNHFSTNNCETMQGMLYNCSVLNQAVNNWDTSKVESTKLMFQGCTNFNQDVSNFNTSAVTDMYSMFRSCTNFNQDLTNFDYSNVLDITLFLDNATSFSRANYDALLIELDSQSLQPSLTLDVSSQYTLGGAAETARTNIISGDSWTINDLGGV